MRHLLAVFVFAAVRLTASSESSAGLLSSDTPEARRPDRGSGRRQRSPNAPEVAKPGSRKTAATNDPGPVNCSPAKSKPLVKPAATPPR